MLSHTLIKSTYLSFLDEDLDVTVVVARDDHVAGHLITTYMMTMLFKLRIKLLKIIIEQLPQI